MKYEQILKTLSTFSQKEILIIGDVGLDIYTTGEVTRISPEAPVPILHVQNKNYKLGLAANVSDNIRELKGTPITCGVIGKDSTADQLTDLFSKKKISQEYLIQDSQRPTIAKERITTLQQQIVRVDYESNTPISDSSFDKILKTIDNLKLNSNTCILQDYGKGFFTEKTTPLIISKLKSKNYTILLDPNTKSDLKWFQGVHLVKPNSNESQSLTNIKAKGDAEFEKIAQKIKELTGAIHVVITRGGDGISIFEENKKHQKIPAFAREVFDVSGAGDTFIAVLSLCIANHTNLIDSCFLANLTSAIEVGKRGTATVTPDEILREAKILLS